MQTPRGMQLAGMMHPDQILALLTPLMGDSMRAGAHADGLREAMLAAYLVGAGMAPAMATGAIAQWKSAGILRELAGQQRPESGAVTPAGDRQKADLARMVERFMKDQATAAIFYSDLLERAPDARAKEYIRHAMEDEQKHYRMLGALYRELTGRTHEATPDRVTFSNLAEGIMRAMDDEYEAMEEYRDVYMAQTDRRIRNLFFELMTDELEHATRFDHVLKLIGG